CGGTGTVTPTAGTPRVTATPSASPSGPCASVRTTTAIEDVPPACAALWRPYGVTKVPPPDILQQEHVPPAPPVRNKTGGAVSDAEAQHWADASNYESGWVKWAEANDEPGLLRHLSGPAVILPAEVAALEQGATIAQPDCNLYPSAVAVFRVSQLDNSYLARKGLPTDNSFAIVDVATGPCSARATYPDGRTAYIAAL